MANAHQLGCLVVLGNLVILGFLGNLVVLDYLVVLGNLVVLGLLGNLVVLGNLVILAFLVVLSNLGRLVVFMVSRHSCLTAHPCLLLYSLYYLLYLLIKRFFKGTKLVFSFNTASPPCLQEPKPIAQQLSKGCCHAKQGDMQAAKLGECMHEKGQRVNQ